ncbi:MAG: hypothetical protein HUN04_04950 [Desulfobacter sp.]|nr:MAG: hypothetical protein HUN04_04950 [Desulfobacter sp.]
MLKIMMHRWIAVAVLCLCLAGCFAAGWGRLVHSNRLMDLYRDGNLAGNHAYYYCGREGLPYAVVGIDPSYTFTGRFWFRIESREELYRKIGHLSNLEPWHTAMHAKEIISASGRVVGTWFSYYNTTSIEIDEAARKVNVHNPYKPETRFPLGG